VVRTQLQIDDDTYEALRLRAHLEHKSMSAVVREVLREGLGPKVSNVRERRPKYSFISSGASGRTDISERHDEVLAEDFR
jgi:plasmid stability protein